MVRYDYVCYYLLKSFIALRHTEMSLESTPIICDTNIWYHLANRSIAPEEIAGKHLIGTYVSAYEFSCSFVALNDYDLFRRAVINFRHFPKKTYQEDPTEYIKRISNLKSIIPQWAKIEQSLCVVEERLHLPDTNEIRQQYANYYAEIEKLHKPFEALINEHRNQIRYKGIHKEKMNRPESRLAHKEITKQLLTNFLSGVSIDWDRIELSLATFDEWLRQLSLISTLKMTPHDWNDVLNLVYVQPGSLYWTRDEAKTKVFIKNVSLGHYLYEAD